MIRSEVCKRGQNTCFCLFFPFWKQSFEWQLEPRPKRTDRAAVSVEGGCKKQREIVICVDDVDVGIPDGIYVVLIIL